jgi:hypothetical protein
MEMGVLMVGIFLILLGWEGAGGCAGWWVGRGAALGECGPRRAGLCGEGVGKRVAGARAAERVGDAAGGRGVRRGRGFASRI